jgi:hypothetical protein
MKCAIHQPQFMPWLGYLHKIRSADKFVFLDNVQFKKNEFQNRNRVLVAGTAKWLTVPVSFHFGDTLLETRIADNIPWRKKIIHAVGLNYAKAPCFHEFREDFEGVLGQAYNNLAELNEASVRWLMKCFDIRTEVFVSSQMGQFDSDPTRRLIDICVRAGADTYLSGAGGHKYLETAQFEKAGIKLEFQYFRHPVYPQQHASSSFVPTLREVGTTEDKQLTEKSTGFAANLSAIDGLFNCGGGEAGRKKLNIGI